MARARPLSVILSGAGFACESACAVEESLPSALTWDRDVSTGWASLREAQVSLNMTNLNGLGYFLNKFSNALRASSGRAAGGVEVSFSTLTRME